MILIGRFDPVCKCLPNRLIIPSSVAVAAIDPDNVRKILISVAYPLPVSEGIFFIENYRACSPSFIDLISPGRK